MKMDQSTKRKHFSKNKDKSKKLRAISHDDAEEQRKKESQITLKMNSFFNVDAGSRMPYKFPHKLFYIVDSGEYSHVVQWNEDGDAFQIKNEETFIKDVLLHMSKETKFPSFHRKLNRWKFIKVRRHKLTWRHPLFKRNRIDLCSYIKEGSPSTLSKNLRNKQSEEHDLHDLEPLEIQQSHHANPVVVHPNYYPSRQCQKNLEGLVSYDTTRMGQSQSIANTSFNNSSFGRQLPPNRMNVFLPFSQAVIFENYPPFPILKSNIAINMTPTQVTNVGLQNLSFGTINFVTSHAQDRNNNECSDTSTFIGICKQNALSKLDDSKEQGIDNPCLEQTNNKA